MKISELEVSALQDRSPKIDVMLRKKIIKNIEV
jgi:hypothetical protein